MSSASLVTLTHELHRSILTTSTLSPSISADYVDKYLAKIASSRTHAHPSLMIDASHANSSKNYKNQPIVCDDICRQLEAGQKGISGVMIESNLKEGKQNSDKGRENLEYG